MDTLTPLLVEAGLTTLELIHAAKASKLANGGTLLEHLVLTNGCSDEALATWLGEYLMIRVARDEHLDRPAAKAIATLDADIVAEFRVLPFGIDAQRTLRLAMSNPADNTAVSEIEFFSGCKVERYAASQVALARGLAVHYGIRSQLLEHKTGHAKDSANAVAAPTADTPVATAAAAPEVIEDDPTSAAAPEVIESDTTTKEARVTSEAETTSRSESEGGRARRQSVQANVSLAGDPGESYTSIAEAAARATGVVHDPITAAAPTSDAPWPQFADLTQSLDGAQTRHDVFTRVLEYYRQDERNAEILLLNDGEASPYREDGETAAGISLGDSPLLEQLLSGQKSAHLPLGDDALATLFPDSDNASAAAITVKKRLLGFLASGASDCPAAHLGDAAGAIGIALERIIRASKSEATG